jgi:hypothetical protein
MGKEQQPGGDYGYDLVHEDVPATAERPDGADGGTPPAAAAEDLSGDIGYDEAHDF